MFTVSQMPPCWVLCFSDMNHSSQESSCGNNKVLGIYFLALLAYNCSYLISFVQLHIMDTITFNKFNTSFT